MGKSDGTKKIVISKALPRFYRHSKNFKLFLSLCCKKKSFMLVNSTEAVFRSRDHSAGLDTKGHLNPSEILYSKKGKGVFRNMLH